MKLFIYKLGEILYEGEADSVTMPTETGEITVLHHHIPLVTHLAKGTIRIKNGAAKEFQTNGGFAEIKPEKVILLVE
jgi:F-type H+-transporting ATPase subunit epsilon